MAGNAVENVVSGVGGWLKLLVVVLTWLGPLVALSLSAWAGVLQAKLLGFSLLGAAVHALFLAMGYFSFSAGRALAGKKEGAVKKTRLFFELLMGAAGIAVVYALNLAFFSKVSHVAVLQIIEAAIGVIIYALAWHSYLSNSVRVRNTYR